VVDEQQLRKQTATKTVKYKETFYPRLFAGSALKPSLQPANGAAPWSASGAMQ